MAIVRTVLGDISGEDLGPTLPHEHVQVAFVEHDAYKTNPADRDAARQTMLPYLAELRDLGCTALIDCTPSGLGRDPRLLQDLSRESGVHLLTNTGFYQMPWLPVHVETSSVETLATHFIDEAENGLDGTGIRPGFIKIALSTSDSPLSPLQERILRAGLIAGKTCGLTVAAHTIGDRPLLDALAVISQESFPANRFVWVHASTGTAIGRQTALEAGINIEIDTISPATLTQDARLVADLLTSAFRDQILASTDRGWYDPSLNKQSIKPFAWFWTDFIPTLRTTLQEIGASADLVDHLVVENPARIFSIQSIVR